MKCVINRQVVLSRPPEGPFAAHLVAFAQSMSERGYGLWSLKYQVRIAACFCRWLLQKKIAVRRISSEHPALYLRYRYRHQRPHREDSAALRLLIEFLRVEGVIPHEKISARRLTPVERCTQGYEKYLREARGLARATITNYLPFIRDFLKDRFGDGPVTLSKLCAGDVVKFVQRQVPRLDLKRAKLMTTALRSFLRYARYCGDIALDLAAAVPVVANWPMTSIPRAIAVEHVRQLLGSIDRQTAIGRRDYAILLLLARLGLRSGEVASLELDDIDWNAGQFSVRGKGGQRNDLPLTAEIGKAIAAYLRQGRPHSTSRRVFLRAKAPIRGFIGASGVGSIVRHSLERAGINSPTKGAHQFRHGLATEMLRQGATLGEIGELLGHRHPTDDEDLRQGRSHGIAYAGIAMAGRCEMNTLRQAVQEYLSLRRGLGFKLHDAGKGLLDFVTFMEQRRATYITQTLALAWAQQPSNVQPAHWAQRLTFVRGFARHRSATDPRTQIPAQGLLPFHAKRARPYLYSDNEIRSLLCAALEMPCRYERGELLPWTYHCLFGLLSVSGLRLGEARNLELQDVDFKAAVLTIRSTKFGKSRLVPLHASTCQVLADYIARRKRHWATRAVSSYLFVSSWGNRLDGGQIHRTFYALSRKIGLRGVADSHGPRLHDMRHVFATTTLVHWYQSGQDPERRLPILSAYLGHVHVADTQWYLSASPELMREAMQRLEQRWEGQP